MDALQAVIAARELLKDVTPLKRDCGRYCGAACCQSDEDGQGGMLLFPGEEALYDPLPEGFSITRDDAVSPGALLLTCSGRCDRRQRPLSCRIFPLLPSVGGCGMDRCAWAVCPLMEYGKAGLDPAFTEAVGQAGKILCGCPEHEVFLENLWAYNERLKQF